MDYLVALTLPETHENRRHRIVNAALVQLSVNGDAILVSGEVGIRAARRSDAPGDTFRLLRVRVEGETDVKAAIEHIANAMDAGNDMLRAVGIRHHQIHIFLRPADKGKGADETEA